MAHKRVEGAALVTGAGSGIGHAVCVALSVSGVNTLYTTDINASGLEATETAILNLKLPSPPTIKSIPGDIASPEFITELFSQISFLDYAINCAGVLGENKPTAEVSLGEFDRLNSINYRGLWMCVKEELKLMLKNDLRPYPSFTLSEQEARIRGQRGSIVNIASQLGIVGKTQASIYTASKAAVLSMTRSDAIDYSKPPHHIRINSVCPGIIATPMTSDENGEVSERLKNAINIAPMERMGLPSEIADTAVFLCSGESSFITGHGLVADGGYVIN
ncbi:2-(R)-hydroxypropyl-CoM dehydrogenase [Cucurbitaria berberidis CBS 394.84]|uniref:2-(R)-hydroxypropyl-CoM dehydrogenase n=1 Tax=Cucurbitaria berberidis CBS 394.84 TaxID=1168544 RepID=A0A9P4LC31_9PLEO|nr:2-(R)-hydroxypropyl-CoM dehydrogenase [Cucurbitaria berberidis CBS 394.84]KAF1848749.1 2-(R)-hydroxypropyl-CoM dehydrogenase [Cucurbitaria berberidis CBS 394.84]